ncbi:hypothetical protein AUC71_01075 [Methyloceanibacter marginalis]|uniref:Uncharacterized protein n=1 Tax=Methyloceanibacter marginalis TaxID=1774971 RepID=A0A1E3WC03_9HYPH|nr:hypothetical protein [Methyloceanibacter marginalis]ODS03260.1 hypothetical protein AUC71_01075 [Methyloceanibacter marginalis]
MKFQSRFVAVALALGLALAASPAAAECNPDDALFEDEFEFLDVSWGESDDNLYVEDGAWSSKNTAASSISARGTMAPMSASI